MSNIKDARIQDNSARSCNRSAKRFGVSQKNPGFSRGYLFSVKSVQNTINPGLKIAPHHIVGKGVVSNYD